MVSSGRNRDRNRLLQERLPSEVSTELAFDRWFEPYRRGIMVAVQRLLAEVSAALDKERAKVHEKEGYHRTVWKVSGTDGSSLLKSTSSIHSKLARELGEREEAGCLLEGRLSMEQMEALVLSFPDLGRMRIVCDLSSDLGLARKCLISKKPQRLLGRYHLKGKLKDYRRDLGLRRPASGHRAVQFAVRVPEDKREFLIEIQLMTLLQTVWDQHNHPLYEWQRDGGRLPPGLQVIDISIAETLLLIDEQAASNWKTFMRLKKGRKR